MIQSTSLRELIEGLLRQSQSTLKSSMDEALAILEGSDERLHHLRIHEVPVELIQFR